MKSLASYTEEEIQEALRGAEGLVLRAAEKLEVPTSTLMSALHHGRYKHLGKFAKRLRTDHGHGSGHPVVHEIDRRKFLLQWKATGQSVNAMAKHFGCAHVVIYRHLEKFDVPGRPQPPFLQRTG